MGTGLNYYERKNMETTNSALTSYSKASGCGCKIQPEILHNILQGFTASADFPGLIVGNATSDDASVLKLNEDTALIQTIDFFTPIVNNPEAFGRIAAANAISDVYAMGGKPVMANVVLCYPVDAIAADDIRAMFTGAAAVCAEAGIPMAGGHSINIGELVFGLSVTGTAHPDQIKTNGGAKPGDLLLLTKPLGTGIISAALKRGLASQEAVQALETTCGQLNKVGEALGKLSGVHAMTDVTGFGFYGHLYEMCKAAGVTATITFNTLPLLEEAKGFAAGFVLPDNAFRNWNAVKDQVETTVKEAFTWLNDPQTNGGLLIAVSEESLTEVQEILRNYGLEDFTIPIGDISEKKEKPIYVV